MIAVLVISPALWGLGGRVDPVGVPESWNDARSVIESRPGTTLALPWNQYVDLQIADGRRTYLPVSALIDGDVINSSDPEFGPPIQEAADPRDDTVTAALDAFDVGKPLSVSLATIGVRWIVVVRGVDDTRFDELRSDEGLRTWVSDDSISLYELRTWSGTARTAAGHPADVGVVIPPLARVGEVGGGVWYAPGAPGWMRNLNSASMSSTGLIEVPEGSGPIWYWPSIVVIAGYLATFFGVIWALEPLVSNWWRDSREGPASEDGIA